MSETESLNELRSLLEELLPGCDFSTDARFVSDRVFGSLDLIVVRYGLETHYDLHLENKDMNPENFESLESIQQLIARYLPR